MMFRYHRKQGFISPKGFQAQSDNTQKLIEDVIQIFFLNSEQERFSEL